jgi:protein tyrosine/serine phosphatase
MAAVMERRLEWEGCVNARDLGGHPLPGGRRTTFSAVVRAENVRRLTDAGWEALVDYGVRTIVDLRFPSELAADAPRDIPVDVVHVPLLDEHNREAWAAIERWDTTAAGYLEMLAWFRPNFARAIRAIADAPPGCVLVHCNAGKDRTGLVVALLLVLAGVPPEEIAADYGLSQPNVASWTAEWIAEAPDETERERRRRISAGEPHAMLDVLAELERRYGSARRYLIEGGATEEELDRAVARLVDRG